MMNNSNLDPKLATNATTNLQSRTTVDAGFHQKFQLLEERLKVNLRRRKVGEVIIRKEVEIQTIEIPIRRETLIVEQIGSEHRQLASIDIGKAEYTEDEITELMHAADAQVMQSMADHFIQAKAAYQVLKEVLSKPDYQSTKVKLTFEDPNLQSIYQQWLERHLAEV